MIDRQPMKNITVLMPENYVINLEKLQTIGMIPSRSEGMRKALYDFLKKEMQNCKLLEFESQVK
jgi:Arc/MetJ-type ribon-helix-helix transcriptional regulator